MNERCCISIACTTFTLDITQLCKKKIAMLHNYTITFETKNVCIYMLCVCVCVCVRACVYVCMKCKNRLTKANMLG